NARRSAQSRAQLGKTRSSRNTTPRDSVLELEELPEEVELMARALYGDDASPAQKEFARTIAECNDIIRSVRQMRTAYTESGEENITKEWDLIAHSEKRARALRKKAIRLFTQAGGRLNPDAIAEEPKERTAH